MTSGASLILASGREDLGADSPDWSAEDMNMRNVLGVFALLSMLWLGGCAADVCDPPVGCFRAASARGSS